MYNIYIYYMVYYIHSFSSLSYDRSKASSKASSPLEEAILYNIKKYIIYNIIYYII